MTLPVIQDVHIDRPLTEFSLRYMNDAQDFVADRAFPILPSQSKSDLYFTYTPGYWFRDDMALRAPGEPYAETGYGLSTDSYVCEQWALSKSIPDEVRNNSDEPLEPDREASELLAHKALIRRERAYAGIAHKTGVWATDKTLSTTWGGTSTPIENIQTAKRAIKNASGQTANAIVMGKIVQDTLEVNAEITDKVKYSQRALPQDIRSILAAVLDLEYVLVSNVVYESAAEGNTAALLPIINDSALVLYRPEKPGVLTATAGMTFVWIGGGGMGELKRWRDERNDSDVAKFKMHFVHKVVATALGYYFNKPAQG